MIDRRENIWNMNQYLFIKLGININRYWQNELLWLCSADFYEHIGNMDREQVINSFCDDCCTTKSWFRSRR